VSIQSSNGVDGPVVGRPTGDREVPGSIPGLRSHAFSTIGRERPDCGKSVNALTGNRTRDLPTTSRVSYHWTICAVGWLNRHHTQFIISFAYSVSLIYIYIYPSVKSDLSRIENMLLFLGKLTVFFSIGDNAHCMVLGIYSSLLWWILYCFYTLVRHGVLFLPQIEVLILPRIPLSRFENNCAHLKGHQPILQPFDILCDTCIDH